MPPSRPLAPALRKIMTSFTSQSPAAALAALPSYNSLQNAAPLPPPPSIRALHIYDFDNTLFNSPLPNPKLWHTPTLSNLQQPSWLATGGWWHDSAILAATGSGLEIEEPLAWKGHWNEHVASLVRLSMEQKGALTILLTGRQVTGFSSLIQRMVTAKGLGFDMIVLKNDGEANTIDFKKVFLKTLVEAYDLAEEIKIYEDRPKHLKSFTEFLSTTYPHLKSTVVPVAEETRLLPPSIELREVQKLLLAHNTSTGSGLRIKKTVLFTGYLLSSASTAHVLNALGIPHDPDIKLLGNSVLIAPRPATRSMLACTGPMGTKVEFEVVEVGNWDGRVWAAAVKPVDPRQRIWTENPRPVLVLSHKRNAKAVDAGRISNWTVPRTPGVRFWASVGEKVVLRIEEVTGNEGEWESLFPRRRG